jgi:predicted alpha/beta hydrolase family esterase
MIAAIRKWNARQRMATSFASRLVAIYCFASCRERTSAALALGVEAVSRQPEVDPARIALVGASLGVPSTVAALDLTRLPAAGALLYGGADIETWMRDALTRHGSPRRLAGVAASAAFAFVRGLEPVAHAGRASPVRMLIVNARFDRFVPLAAAEALHRAFPHAAVRWKEGPHLDGRPGTLIDGLAAEVEAWLEAQDAGAA